MKKLAIQSSNISRQLVLYFLSRNVDVSEFSSDIDKNDYDLIFYDDYRGELADNILTVHESLLPSFHECNSVENAFSFGVKISGVTISSNFGIVAQYPVFLSEGMHFDEFRTEILKAKYKLSKMVIENILEDRFVDYSSIFADNGNKNCNCTNCKGCH